MARDATVIASGTPFSARLGAGARFDLDADDRLRLLLRRRLDAAVGAGSLASPLPGEASDAGRHRHRYYAHGRKHRREKNYSGFSLNLMFSSVSSV